jgi:hypothetical protein
MSDSEFKPVQLVDPDGNDYTATSPAEHINLVFGAGYREKKSSAAKKDEAKS